MSKSERSLRDRLLCLLYPQHCAFCGDVIGPDRYLCEACAPLAVSTDGFCPSCGKIRAECCCLGADHLYDDFTAPLFYTGAAVQAYYGFKFRGNRERGDYFISEMLRVFQRDFGDVKFDCICFVPGSHSRKENGGYVPAMLLAKGIARQTKIPLQKNMLRKIAKNQRQHALDRVHRRENVRGVYRATSAAGKTILLIDDIKTTGATLDECAKELKLSGAKYVCALTAFATLFREPNVVEKNTGNGYNETIRLNRDFAELQRFT